MKDPENNLEQFKSKLRRINKAFNSYKYNQTSNLNNSESLARKVQSSHVNITSFDKRNLYEKRNRYVNEKMLSFRHNIEQDVVNVGILTGAVQDQKQLEGMVKSWKKAKGKVSPVVKKISVLQINKRGDANRFVQYNTSRFTGHPRAPGRNLRTTHVTFTEGDIIFSPSLAPINKDKAGNIPIEDAITDVKNNKIPMLMETAQEIHPDYPDNPNKIMVTCDFTSVASFDRPNGGWKWRWKANGEEKKNHQDAMLYSDYLAQHSINQQHGRPVRLIYQNGVNGCGHLKDSQKPAAKESRVMGYAAALFLLKESFDNSEILQQEFPAEYNKILEKWELFNKIYKEFLDQRKSDTESFHEFLAKNGYAENPFKLNSPAKSDQDFLDIFKDNNLDSEELAAAHFYRLVASGEDREPENAIIAQSLAGVLSSSKKHGNVIANDHCKSTIDRAKRMFARKLQMFDKGMKEIMKTNIKPSILNDALSIAVNDNGATVDHQGSCNQVASTSKAAKQGNWDNKNDIRQNTSNFESSKMQCLTGSKAGKTQAHKYQTKVNHKKFKNAFKKREKLAKGKEEFQQIERGSGKTTNGDVGIVVNDNNQRIRTSSDADDEFNILAATPLDQEAKNDIAYHIFKIFEDSLKDADLENDFSQREETIANINDILQPLTLKQCKQLFYEFRDDLFPLINLSKSSETYHRPTSNLNKNDHILSEAKNAITKQFAKGANQSIHDGKNIDDNLNRNSIINVK